MEIDDGFMKAVEELDEVLDFVRNKTYDKYVKQLNSASSLSRQEFLESKESLDNKVESLTKVFAYKDFTKVAIRYKSFNIPSYFNEAVEAMEDAINNYKSYAENTITYEKNYGKYLNQMRGMINSLNTLIGKKVKLYDFEGVVQWYKDIAKSVDEMDKKIEEMGKIGYYMDIVKLSEEGRKEIISMLKDSLNALKNKNDEYGIAKSYVNMYRSLIGIIEGEKK